MRGDYGDSRCDPTEGQFEAVREPTGHWRLHKQTGLTVYIEVITTVKLPLLPSVKSRMTRRVNGRGCASAAASVQQIKEFGW